MWWAGEGVDVYGYKLQFHGQHQAGPSHMSACESDMHMVRVGEAADGRGHNLQFHGQRQAGALS